jgi:hypothetical protein
METAQAFDFTSASTSPGVHLKRLGRLLQLRQRHQRDLNRQGLRLLVRAVFAAYCDCREAGAQEEARRLLREGLTVPPVSGQLALDGLGEREPAHQQP